MTYRKLKKLAIPLSAPYATCVSPFFPSLRCFFSPNGRFLYRDRLFFIHLPGCRHSSKAAQDKYGPVPADATEEQRQAYLAKPRDTPEYKKEQEKYGTGSDMQRGIQAATAALQGLAGGNMAGALAGASAPELAHLLKSTEKDPAVNAIAHAILGGAVAAMQGNNVAAGAAGAATGELAARAIAGMLYLKEPI
ncbi:hemagglutinin-related protein [Escherichia coli]|nr:hemagglutinin-related protein [Escherichia coli]CAD5790777.1 hemagglutinin-related protein [Escherichia coli]CAD5791425.1 hemagglutinin-related protein [Escherichia coli]